MCDWQGITRIQSLNIIEEIHKGLAKQSLLLCQSLSPSYMEPSFCRSQRTPAPYKKQEPLFSIVVVKNPIYTAANGQREALLFLLIIGFRQQRLVAQDNKEAGWNSSLPR
jgi:hypothetical protein